jgi:hypothetical protein
MMVSRMKNEREKGKFDDRKPKTEEEDEKMSDEKR